MDVQHFCPRIRVLCDVLSIVIRVQGSVCLPRRGRIRQNHGQ